MTRTLALFAICFTVAIGIHGQRRPPENGQCNKEDAAYDEVRLRAMASQTSLELLREYSKALDIAYRDTYASAAANSGVDLASLVMGWPLGTAIQNKLRGEVQKTLTEKLIKAGFTSVEKALIKDPSLNGILENFTSGSGASSDLAKEYNKHMLEEYRKHLLEQKQILPRFQKLFGEDAAESITAVFDLMEFVVNTYEGVNKLEAIRALGRSTDEQIVRLQAKHGEQMDYMDSAQRARDICYDRFYKNLPPDTNNRFWADVMEYLGPNWKAPEFKEPEKIKSATTNDSRFFGTWRCQFNYSITLNEDGTGVFTDSRGGPQGSLYASGTFNGKWTSSGNKAYLDLGREYGNRSGTFVLTLNDGKLSDQFGGVFTK